MMNAFKKLLAVVAAITMWATIQPGTASAQSSGIGGDGVTRILWTGTDGRISLWKLGGPSAAYGPYDGWIPVAITTRNDNKTVVLWRRTDGLMTVWLVDTNLNYISQVYFGPYYGWVPESLSVDTNGNDWIRVIWKETQGSVSVWFLDGNLVYQGSNVYGPYFGWNPAVAGNAAASSPANTKAAAGMTATPSSPKPFPGK
jgi:hypothetical protein